MSKYFAVKIYGVIKIHLPDTSGNYYTLCGLDGMDDEVGQSAVDVPLGAKVDCRECRKIWDVCKDFSINDFAAPNIACSG